MKTVPDQSKRAFTLIELLVVIAIIGILAAMLLPTLSRAKGHAKKISCINHQRQLALAMRLYVDDNQGHFPPRARVNLWPSRIYDGFKDARLLVCPSDGPNPATWGGGDPVNFTVDAKPRSYIYNGWNDFMKETLVDTNMDAYMKGVYGGATIKDSHIRQPSDTPLLGEKLTDSPQFHMDLLELELGGAVGNDLFQLDRSRHGGDGRKNSGAGGSNYAMADNSVRFIKYRDILWPINLWAVTDAGRISYAVKPE